MTTLPQLQVAAAAAGGAASLLYPKQQSLAEHLAADLCQLAVLSGIQLSHCPLLETPPAV